jgi:hypothetical protein
MKLRGDLGILAKPNIPTEDLLSLHQKMPSVTHAQMPHHPRHRVGARSNIIFASDRIEAVYPPVGKGGVFGWVSRPIGAECSDM